MTTYPKRPPGFVLYMLCPYCGRRVPIAPGWISLPAAHVRPSGWEQLDWWFPREPCVPEKRTDGDLSRILQFEAMLSEIESWP